MKMIVLLMVLALIFVGYSCQGAAESKEANKARTILEQFLRDNRIENSYGWNIEFAFMGKIGNDDVYNFAISYHDKEIQIQPGMADVIPQRNYVSSLNLMISSKSLIQYPLVVKSAPDLQKLAHDFIVDHYSSTIKEYMLSIRYIPGGDRQGIIGRTVSFNISLTDKNSGIQVGKGIIEIGINTGKVVQVRRHQLIS